MVIDRNKPDAEIRKDVLKVIAGFNIVRANRERSFTMMQETSPERTIAIIRLKPGRSNNEV